jgi:hypothetical protein
VTFSPAPVGIVAKRSAQREVEFRKRSRASATAISWYHAGRAGRPSCSGPCSCILDTAQRAHRMRARTRRSARSEAAVIAVAIASRVAPSLAMRPFVLNAVRLAPGCCGDARFVARPPLVPTLPTAAIWPLAVVLNGAKRSRVRDYAGHRLRRRNARGQCSSATQCGPDQGSQRPTTHCRSPSCPRHPGESTRLGWPRLGQTVAPPRRHVTEWYAPGGLPSGKTTRRRPPTTPSRMPGLVAPPRRRSRHRRACRP